VDDVSFTAADVVALAAMLTLELFKVPPVVLSDTVVAELDVTILLNLSLIWKVIVVLALPSALIVDSAAVPARLLFSPPDTVIVADVALNPAALAVTVRVPDSIDDVTVVLAVPSAALFALLGLRLAA
jgi:hypothetical protein